MKKITLEQAEILSKRTDYARFASEQSVNPINTGDAAAFYLEGYNQAIDDCNERHEAEMVEYEIDFNGHVKVKLNISNNKIEIVGAMNGYGDLIPFDLITISDPQFSSK